MVPKDALVAKLDEGFGDGECEWAQPGAEATAEQESFHIGYLIYAMRLIALLGVINIMWDINYSHRLSAEAQKIWVG